MPSLRLDSAPANKVPCPSGDVELSPDPAGTGHDQRDLLCAAEVRILIIDDDQAVCWLTAAALRREGFVIDIVSDVGKVEERLRGPAYHVIILDYVIPGLKTEQILEWVKEHQADASIIVVTGYPSVDSALQCLRARTYDYLTKPFQIAHLQRVVTRCLEGKGLLRLSGAMLLESLGAAIREKRKSQRLTLQQLAQRAHISLGYLSQVELGKNSPSIESLYKTCLGLGITLAELFQLVQTPAQQS
jgi:DNA-binding response OmpR family regulator